MLSNNSFDSSALLLALEQELELELVLELLLEQLLELELELELLLKLELLELELELLLAFELLLELGLIVGKFKSLNCTHAASLLLPSLRANTLLLSLSSGITTEGAELALLSGAFLFNENFTFIVLVLSEPADPETCQPDALAVDPALLLGSFDRKGLGFFRTHTKWL